MTKRKSTKNTGVVLAPPPDGAGPRRFGRQT